MTFQRETAPLGGRVSPARRMPISSDRRGALQQWGRTPTSHRPVRVLVLADTDSHLTWGAALADQLPANWQVEVVIVRGPAMPSGTRLDDALAGTSSAGRRLQTVGLHDLQRRLSEQTPDVLVLAASGRTVRATVSVVEDVPTRPVIVTGLPGVALSVPSDELGLRRAADVFVVHSRREVRELRQVARRMALPDRFELARLPHLERTPRPGPAGRRRGHHRRGPLVFAAQDVVPGTRGERVRLVERLAAIARSEPDREVVITVRARTGRTRSDQEKPFQQVVEALPHRPANLVVRSGPLHEHLAEASALATTSPTALLEAVSVGVPAIALEDVGAKVPQTDVALEGSGLVGSVEDLMAGRFGSPRPQWCADNYFHDPAEDTWLPRVTTLVQQRRTSGLPPLDEAPGSWRGDVRDALCRQIAFEDGPSTADDHGRLAASARRRLALGALWLDQRRSHQRSPSRPAPRDDADRERAEQDSLPSDSAPWERLKVS